MEHPNIIRLYDHLEQNGNIYLLLEHAQRGNLFHFLNAQRGFDTKLIARIFHQTCRAIEHIHSKSFVHRDLKPENILLDQELNVKLCDFGWCCNIHDYAYRKVVAGTYEYMSPETLNGLIQGFESDVWSLGVLLFELFHNVEPFKGRNIRDVLHSIKTTNLSFNSSVVPEARDLILSILKVEPRDRPTMSQILSSPFVTKYANVQTQNEPQLSRHELNKGQVFKRASSFTSSNTREGRMDRPDPSGLERRPIREESNTGRNADSQDRAPRNCSLNVQKYHNALNEMRKIGHVKPPVWTSVSEFGAFQAKETLADKQNQESRTKHNQEAPFLIQDAGLSSPKGVLAEVSGNMFAASKFDEGRFANRKPVLMLKHSEQSLTENQAFFDKGKGGSFTGVRVNRGESSQFSKENPVSRIYVDRDQFTMQSSPKESSLNNQSGYIDRRRIHFDHPSTLNSRGSRDLYLEQIDNQKPKQLVSRSPTYQRTERENTFTGGSFIQGESKTAHLLRERCQNRPLYEASTTRGSKEHLAMHKQENKPGATRNETARRMEGLSSGLAGLESRYGHLHLQANKSPPLRLNSYLY